MIEIGEVEDLFPHHLVIGVDEVGMGVLAGPVAAGAVCLDLLCPLAGIDDSKKLSPTRRRAAAERIRREIAIVHSVHMLGSAEVDRLGLGRAAERVRMAAAVAVLEELDLLGCRAEILLVVDGENRIGGHPRLRGVEQRTFTKGDRRSYNIAAASILAKVERDRFMLDVVHKRFPDYGFDKHQGYGTPQHLAALSKYGPCEFHRRSVAIVADAEES